MLGSKLSIVFIILFCSFFVMLQPVTVIDSVIEHQTEKESNHNENKTSTIYPKEIKETSNTIKNVYNIIKHIYKYFKDPFLLILGLLIGFFLNFFLNKKTIRMSDVIDRSNKIKTIFVYDFVQINNLDKNDNSAVGDIVVSNINNTETLIQQFLFYVSKSKAKKIERHYNEYKKPYETCHNAKVMLKGLRSISGKPNDKSFLYTNNKIPNAREIALKHLKVLIKDFERV